MGDAAYRDQSLARAERALRAVNAANIALETALMGIGAEAREDGLEAVAEWAGSAVEILNIQFKADALDPLRAAVAAAKEV